MPKIKLCDTKNGIEVYYDPLHSHVATHFKDTPKLKTLVKKLISTHSFKEKEIYAEFKIDKVVVLSDLVETNDNDEIIYAKRLNRKGYTRFVKNRKPEKTSSSYLTIWLKQDEERKYDLASAWIGRTCPAFPDDEYAIPESKPFWEKHALVWGNQEIQSGTETTKSPW